MGLTQTCTGRSAINCGDNVTLGYVLWHVADPFQRSEDRAFDLIDEQCGVNG